MLTNIKITSHNLLQDVDINLQNGLIVFSGPSGSGKSVFFNTLLSAFAIKNHPDGNVEVIYKNKDYQNIYTKKTIPSSNSSTKTSLFLNNKKISKNNLLLKTKNEISFLHVQDLSDFTSVAILNLLDCFIAKSEKKYMSDIVSLQEDFCSLENSKQELEKLLRDYKELEDKKEFLEFEINEIETINPSQEEYEKILDIKRNLSKKEKIQEKIQEINPIFSYENKITNFLQDLEMEYEFVNEFMLELSSSIEKCYEKFEILNEYSIEELMNKMDDFYKLKQKYGSIEDALIYKEEKAQELLKLKNNSLEKTSLELEIKNLTKSTNELALKISQIRIEYIDNFKKELQSYCDKLYLENINIDIENKNIDKHGIDELQITLNNANYKKLSSGEVNRLRLAMIAIKNKYSNDKGVIILDEIDANLSGKESQSIAKVLYEISKNYQVFAISHQPHLSSYANMHFLVSKSKTKSTIRLIKDDKRIEEIARMISGDTLSSASLKLAQELLENAK